MKYINIVSSLLFLIIGYLVLIEENTFSMSQGEFMENSARIAIFYIAIQGLGYISQKPGKIAEFLLDLAFSMLPFLLVVLSFFIKSDNMSIEWQFFREVYLYATLIDLVVFTVAGFILAVYTDKNARSEGYIYIFKAKKYLSLGIIFNSLIEVRYSKKRDWIFHSLLF